MNKPYVKFTRTGLLIGFLVGIAPWFFKENPPALVCQILEGFTVLAFGFFCACAAYISSPAGQPATDGKPDFIKAA